MGVTPGVDEVGTDQAAKQDATPASEGLRNIDLNMSTSPVGKPTPLNAEAAVVGGLEAPQYVPGDPNTVKPAENPSAIGETQNVVDQQPGSSAPEPPTEAVAPEPPPAVAITTEQASEPSQQQVTNFLNGLGGEPLNTNAPSEAVNTQIGDSGTDNKSSVNSSTEAFPVQNPQEEPVAAAAIAGTETAPSVGEEAALPADLDAPPVATTEPAPAEDAVTQEQTASSTPETQVETPEGLFRNFEEALKEKGIPYVKVAGGLMLPSAGSSPDGSKIIGFDEKQDQSKST